MIIDHDNVSATFYPIGVIAPKTRLGVYARAFNTILCRSLSI
jgi:hypothetical protein